MTAVKYFVIKI